jgi:hypothetical protein
MSGEAQGVLRMLQVSVVDRDGRYAPASETYSELLAAVGKLPELRVLRIVAPAAVAHDRAATAAAAADRAPALAPALPGLEALSKVVARRLTSLEVAVRVEPWGADSQEHFVLPNVHSLTACHVQLVADSPYAIALWEDRGLVCSNLRSLSIMGIGSVRMWPLSGLGELTQLRQLSLCGLQLSSPGQVCSELASSQLRSLNLDWNDDLRA